MKKGCIIFLILNVLTTSALFVGGFILNSEEQESDKQNSTESSPSKDSLSPKDNLSYLKDETHFVAQEKQKGKLKTDVTYYLAEKGYTLSKNTEITVICQTDEQNTLMEDKDGNRFTIPSRSVETQRPLKMINPNYHYYMGGTWLHTFDPYKRPITEIISKWGDYTLCNKQEGSYTFPYLTHVSGISRGHSVTLLTDEKGIVTGSRCSNESSNLFGFLFFYSDILSLNVYEPQGTLLIEPGTDTDNSGSIIEGIYMYVLYTIPAAILLFVILWGMMIVRIVPNNIINFTLRAGTFLIIYVLSIIFLEHYHSVWLILFPCYMGVGYMLIRGLKNYLNLEARCTRCHAINSINRHKEETGRERTIRKCNIHFHLEANGDITHSAYVYNETTVHYHHKDVCEKCKYTQEYNSDTVLKKSIEECPHCGSTDICKEMDIDNIKYKGGKITFDYAYQEYCTLCNESIWEGNGSYYFNAPKPANTPKRRTPISNTTPQSQDNTFRHGYECRYFDSGLSNQMGTGICIKTGCDQNGDKCNKEGGYCPWFELRN